MPFPSKVMIQTDLPERLRSYVRVVTAFDVSEPEPWMTSEERVEAERIRNDRRRAEWILGRVAAKRMAIALDLCADPLDCSVPTRGIRPELRIHGRPSDLNLSISHSGEVAAATISSEPVGIDIQKRRTIPSRSTKFFLRDDESDFVVDPLDSTLLDLWSAKEAALKAAGVSRYREVRLLERRTEADRTSFRFEAGPISGEIETTWLADGEIVLALAKGRR